MIDNEFLAVPTPDERRLYVDLTRLFADMKDTSLMTFYDAIEARYRRYLSSSRHPKGSAELRITLTWCLPEGADGFALYRTEYRTAAADPLPEPLPESETPSTGTSSAAVIVFPRRTPATATPA